jgi:hypothetical protein
MQLNRRALNENGELLNSALGSANFKDAVAAWLKWGEENGYA